MEGRAIGVVKDLFRYPVKSMQGERLNEVDLGPQGVMGDRAYALREANGRVMTAKRWPTLLECSARYEAPPLPGTLPPLRLTLPDGRTMQAHDPDASAVLSTVLGCPVRLERAQADQHHRAAIDPATVFGDVPVETLKPGYTAATLPDSFALPPGTFFDAASLHVLAGGTLAHLRTLIGEDAQLDPRRFRPNIVVETAPEAEGFLEDGWLEGALDIGERVRIVQLRPTLRCVMTTHRQAELGRDLRILRAAAQHHQAQVGVWASVGTPGTVRVGDPVGPVMQSCRIPEACSLHGVAWPHEVLCLSQAQRGDARLERTPAGRRTSLRRCRTGPHPWCETLRSRERRLGRCTPRFTPPSSPGAPGALAGALP